MCRPPGPTQTLPGVSLLAVLGLGGGQARRLRQARREAAGEARRHVLHDQDRHVGLAQAGHHLADGRHAARRGADADQASASTGADWSARAAGWRGALAACGAARLEQGSAGARIALRGAHSARPRCPR